MRPIYPGYHCRDSCHHRQHRNQACGLYPGVATGRISDLKWIHLSFFMWVRHKPEVLCHLEQGCGGPNQVGGSRHIVSVTPHMDEVVPPRLPQARPTTPCGKIPLKLCESKSVCKPGYQTYLPSKGVLYVYGYPGVIGRGRQHCRFPCVHGRP